MSSSPLLSIIIASYNTADLTIFCLNSIIKNIDISYEIIVVDNASSDLSVQKIKELAAKQKQIKLIESSENLGFGRANNLGVINAAGEYLLFLNTDTLIESNVLDNSVEYLQKHPEVGVYSCRLKNKDQSTQASGGYFPTLSRLIVWQLFIDDLPVINRLFTSYHPHLEFYRQNRELDWVTGAFMMIPSIVFSEAGGFDPSIFMYTEEMELCYRIKSLGKKVIYRIDDSIVHYGGGSGGSYLALTSEIKNLLYFYQKHMPTWQYKLAKIAIFKGSLLRLLIFGIMKNNDQARKTYFDALKLLF